MTKNNKQAENKELENKRRAETKESLEIQELRNFVQFINR